MQRFLPARHMGARPAVFLAYLFFSLHAYLILYLNSSFLEQFVDAKHVGLFFSAGAAITLFLLISGPWCIKRFGALTIFIGFLLVEFLSVALIAFVDITPVILLLFVSYRAVTAMLIFMFDLFLESVSKISSGVYSEL